MSDTNSNPVQPVAENFIDTELAKAQASLRRTRIVSVVSILFVVVYTVSVSVTLYTRLLQPKPAAEVATHYTSVFVQENGRALSQQLIEQVPALVAKAPDIALAKLPALRADIEQKIDQTLGEYCRQVAPQLGSVVDEFLVQNKEQVRDFITQAQDSEAVHKLGVLFEEEALTRLHAKGTEGYSAMDRLAEGAAALNTIELQFHRLATADNLTPEEKQTRRMIGLIMQQANRSQPQSS